MRNVEIPVGTASPESVELAVIGQSVLYPECLEVYARRLTAEDFSDQLRASIWQSILDLVEAMGAVEHAALVDRSSSQLPHDRSIPDAMRVLVDAIDLKTSGPANANYYCDIMVRRSRVRRLKGAALRLVQTDTEDPRVLTDYAEQAIQETAIDDIARPVRAYDVLADRYRFYERVLDGKTKIKRIPTGLLDLDDRTGGGFAPGEQWVLAARPSMGKTALSLLCALTAADAGANVLYFSIEMTADSLADRLFGMNARAPAKALAKGIIAENHWPGLVRAIHRLEQASFEIVSRGGLSIGELISVARRAAARKPIDLVVVDYLGNVRPFRGRKYGSREQEIADVSRELKALALELDCTTLVLAQLNREVEKRNESVPRMSDLRESGQIEADADLIMFLHRQYVVDPEHADPEEAQLHIAKQRNGDIGTIKLHFDGPAMLFGNAYRGAL